MAAGHEILSIREGGERSSASLPSLSLPAGKSVRKLGHNTEETAAHCGSYAIY
ncbi:hypothetical protein HMPREF1986_02596 [Oribacterium sp. oral taxon 078 str. F0263]|nr:hypothetical protein HMPREF1986_02596 [Oribacterium sp. oral taxon 078 str. F0263]